MGPSNLSTAQYAVTVSYAHDFIMQIKKEYLTPDKVYIAYTVFYLLKILYLLGTQLLTHIQCGKLDHITSSALLTTQKYPTTLNWAIAMSPFHFGGAGLWPAYCEQGIQMLWQFFSCIWQPEKYENLVYTNVQWAQKMAGMSFKILEKPAVYLPHLTNATWITELQNFLAHIGGTIRTSCALLAPWHHHDSFIMDIALWAFSHHPWCCSQILNSMPADSLSSSHNGVRHCWTLWNIFWLTHAHSLPFRPFLT